MCQASTMKYILVPSVFLFLRSLEINAETYEITEIPYEQIFPESHLFDSFVHRPYGQNYRIPGYQQELQKQQIPWYQLNQKAVYPQAQRLQYQNQNYQNYLSYPNYQQTSVDVSLGNWICRNPSTGQMQAMNSDTFPMINNQIRRKKRQISTQFFPNLIKKLYSTNVPLFQKSPNSVYHPKYLLTDPYEWECRNPMTGNMIIISSDNIPVKNNQESNQKLYIPNQIQSPVPVSNPAPINCNYYPQHPMCGETIILGMTRSPAPEIKPNINGVGLIDIR